MAFTQSGDNLPHRKYGLVGIIFLGLVLGLVYVFLIPPWQHYDEPTHFEYAWLLANDRSALENNSYNTQARRKIAASMIEHGFFVDTTFRPNLLAEQDSIWIGIPQTSDPPLYYFLVSLPLRLVQHMDITVQLYAARLVSLLFFLVTLIFSWFILQEILRGREAALLWLVPVTIVLIPGFLDLMTAVNNDVAATSFFTLFLWASVLILKQGFSLARILGLAVAAGLCYLTKSTVWVAIPLALLVVLLAGLRGRRRLAGWTVAAAGLLVFIIAAVGWGDAAAWVTKTPQSMPTRQEALQAPYGRHALVLALDPQTTSQTAAQLFSPEIRTQMKGQQVTLGAWVWADEPVRVSLGFNSWTGWRSAGEIEVSRQPRYFSVPIKVAAQATGVHAELSAFANKLDKPTRVYFDGIFLVAEPLAVETEPQFADDTLAELITPQGSLQNMFQNPSVERGWLRFRSWAVQAVDENLPVNLDYSLNAFSNLAGTGWYFSNAFESLLQTFWGRFGWGNVPLLGNYSYAVLAVVTFVGAVGTIWALIKGAGKSDRDVLAVLGLAGAALWTQAVLRGISALFEMNQQAVARYAYPAILPTVLLLAAGWLLWAYILSKRSPVRLSHTLALHLVFLAGLNVLAVASILVFF